MGESKSADTISKKAEKLTKNITNCQRQRRQIQLSNLIELNPKPVYNSHELQGEVVSEMGGMKVQSKL